MKQDEIFIKRCLELAAKGIGTTRPNPSVGAVLVVDGKIIGEGYTSPYGGNHAEVNAIRSVSAKNLLTKATLYVTLEPCAHFGKTPPCADLIVESKIPKVVIGCVDTNSLVAGKGIERLLKSGVDVKVGVLEEDCLKHHKRFFTFQNKKRPYIILKWAETQDGFIAPVTKNTKRPVWISNEQSQQLVHKWRSQEHAILVGTQTAIDDNPRLDTRKWGGENPVRILIDRNLRVPSENSLFDGSILTWVLTEKDNSSTHKNINYYKVDFSKNLAKEISKVLFEKNIQSVIIEGGAKTLQTFIDADLWDEARVFKGEVTFESGIAAPKLATKHNSQVQIGTTQLLCFENVLE